MIKTYVNWHPDHFILNEMNYDLLIRSVLMVSARLKNISKPLTSGGEASL